MAETYETICVQDANNNLEAIARTHTKRRKWKEKLHWYDWGSTRTISQAISTTYFEANSRCYWVLFKISICTLFYTCMYTFMYECIRMNVYIQHVIKVVDSISSYKTFSDTSLLAFFLFQLLLKSSSWSVEDVLNSLFYKLIKFYHCIIACFYNVTLKSNELKTQRPALLLDTNYLISTQL